MNEKLEQIKSDYLTKLKQVKLAEAGIGINEVDNYAKYIDSEDAEQIEKQARAVAADIKREDGYGDVYQDSRIWRPFD